MARVVTSAPTLGPLHAVTFTVRVTTTDRRILALVAGDIAVALDLVFDRDGEDYEARIGGIPTDEAVEATTIDADLELED